MQYINLCITFDCCCMTCRGRLHRMYTEYKCSSVYIENILKYEVKFDLTNWNYAPNQWMSLLYSRYPISWDNIPCTNIHLISIFLEIYSEKNPDSCRVHDKMKQTHIINELELDPNCDVPNEIITRYFDANHPMLRWLKYIHIDPFLDERINYVTNDAICKLIIT